MTLKPLIIWLLCCIFCVSTFAQTNLVQNGNFSITQTVNPDLGLINKAKHWFNPSKGTPDLTNRYGNKMAGIYLCSINENNREYIATKLTSPTDTCHFYRFKAVVQLTDESMFGVNTISIGFTKDTVLQQNRFPLKPDFYITFRNPKLNSTSSLDILLDTTFMVNNIYKYLIIGNFIDDAHSDKTEFKAIKNAPPMIPYGYYLVDNVALIETGKPCPPIVSTTMIPILNTPIRLDKVLFENNKYDILPYSYSYLDTLAFNILASNITQITITGHTDSIGNDEENKTLSLSRADAVKQYLVSKGIPSELIKTEGRGSSFPILPNNTPENRRFNRRVEMVVE